jgi:hypothetical protein
MERGVGDTHVCFKQTLLYCSSISSVFYSLLFFLVAVPVMSIAPCIVARSIQSRRFGTRSVILLSFVGPYLLPCHSCWLPHCAFFQCGLQLIAIHNEYEMSIASTLPRVQVCNEMVWINKKNGLNLPNIGVI